MDVISTSARSGAPKFDSRLASSLSCIVPPKFVIWTSTPGCAASNNASRALYSS